MVSGSAVLIERRGIVVFQTDHRFDERVLERTVVNTGYDEVLI